jgi:hypothetical protein
MRRPLAMTMENAPSAAVPPKKCWICGVNDANSGEHLIKKSDLRDVMGKPTQAAPFTLQRHRRAATRFQHLAIVPSKANFPCFGNHPDLESRLTFQEKWVPGRVLALLQSGDMLTVTRASWRRFRSAEQASDL